MQELEKIVQTKSTQLRVVEESESRTQSEYLASGALYCRESLTNNFLALRQKMLAGEGAPPQAAAAAG